MLAADRIIICMQYNKKTVGILPVFSFFIGTVVVENQNSPQQQAADLRMMLDNEPPKQRSSRRSSRGTTLSDIDTMSYDELVAYISDSNSDFADDGAEFDGQSSLYGSRGSDNSNAQPSRSVLPSQADFEPKNLADEWREEEEERAKRAVPYSFAYLGKKQPSNNLTTDSRHDALSDMRTTTPDPQEYPESEPYQQDANQDQAQEHAHFQEEHVDSVSPSADLADDGFDAEGYDAEGFDRDGFDRDGFDRDGFDRDNYDREGYDWEGFDCEGFDRDGFDREGFDRDNYDRDGYDWEGYNWEGFDRDGFDRDGFDRDNYDREGYDWEGYNQYGLDRQGFNRDGFDSEGYDREGFNAEGFDREGFDRDGFDQYNYNREGYDWEGYDCEGYDYGGFDRDGYDKEGYTRQDWESAGYKFGPRGEFILTENEQQSVEADGVASIPEGNNDAQANEQPENEPVEAVKSKANDSQIMAEQDKKDKTEAAEEELPEYNFAAAPPAKHDKVELATVEDLATEEEANQNQQSDSEAATYDFAKEAAEQQVEAPIPQQAAAEQNLAHDNEQQPYEQEYASEDLAHDDEQQPYEQEYAHEDLAHDDEQQPYEQEYTAHEDLAHDDEQQPYEQEYTHEDLAHDDKQQPYEQEYTHEDLAHDDKQQPYEQEYTHEDLAHDDKQQPYKQEYTHEDLAHDDEQQQPAPALQSQPRADVPLFEPEDKFGNMTSPWRYECDYAIDYISGSRRGQRIALLASELGDERSFTIGSPGERVNDIEVDEPTIANDQALLRYSNGRFTLINFQEDIKINKRIVTCGEQVNLMTGDEIVLGNTKLVFSERCVSEALAEYSLDVVEGTETDLGKSFPLTKQRSSIGRDRNSDIPLTDQEISRHHCTLTFRAGKFFLQHRSDTNPTFINGVSVPAGGERQITAEDKIQISSRTVLQLVKH